MSAIEHFVHKVGTVVTQPLMLVDSAHLVVYASQTFCDILGVAVEEIQGKSLFDLPDGRWNGPELRQLLVQQTIRADEAVGTLETEWTLGTVGTHTVSLNVCRLTESEKQEASPLLITIRQQGELRQQPADIAKLLYRATALALTSDSLEETLEFCVSAVCELTGWPIGHVLLTPERDDQPLISTDLWESPENWDITQLRQETKRQEFRLGIGLPGQVWQTREIRWIEAISDFSEWIRRKPIQSLGIKAAIGFPILVGGRVRAILEFFNTEVTPRSAELVMFCTRMAEPVGKVVERQETTERLREANQASMRANQAKSQFLANISHELRTPLTAMLGMLQLSQQEELPLAVRDYLQTVEGSANTLLSLLNDILDFAELESDNLSIISKPFQLREWLDQVVLPYVDLADRKGLQWRLHIDPEIPDRLVSDSLRLRQIIEHLLDNAIKFTEQGSIALHVTAGQRCENEQILLDFTISDTGPGLTRDDQKKMFEGFTQIDSSFTRRHGGAGLGLSICLALVERLGGELSVESKLGEGCQFRFTIPFQSLQRNRKKPGPRNRARSLRAKTAQPLSILLAEDTPANQKVIRNILSKRGHQVTVAGNGREVLQKLGQIDFDVILMDLQMPVMDGYQTTAAIRKNESDSGSHTPIVALTAHSADRDRDACLQAGMDAYLAKPIDIEGLLTLVESSVLPSRQAAAAAEPTGTTSGSESEKSAGDEKPVLDKNRVMDLEATMKRLGGSTELLEEFIEVFHEDTPQLLETLRSAIATENAIRMVRAAHSIKGLAANFSAKDVVSLAAKLEEAGKREDLAEANSLFEQLSEAITQLRASLQSCR